MIQDLKTRVNFRYNEDKVIEGRGSNMPKYYLAIDIGASSGRHMLAFMEEGKLRLEEIYRFENKMTNKDGKLLWDTKRLFREIVTGMKECVRLGKIPESMSIDTWAVDYVLLDANDQLLGDTYAYRDDRTNDCDELVYQYISEEELYERTGIQKQKFNTIYQLMAVKRDAPELFEQTQTFLMLPDYFQFLLTGNKVSEYTNGTSTQLVNAGTGQWDRELIHLLGYPADAFLELQMPGTEVGNLREDIRREVGFDCKVVLCASHDTASAIMAIPDISDSGIYISSGTWSLMGVELPEADCRNVSRMANFTNEGGYAHRFRYLKNIMGLWMIQSVRNEWNKKYSFAGLCELAEESSSFSSIVDVNEDCFLAPESMLMAIRDYCKETKQPIPETPGEMAAVIYKSLALCYERTVKEVEQNRGKAYDRIFVIGGGSNAGYLNRLTARYTGKTVYAGPGEATAIGNAMAQMIRNGIFGSLLEARECVKASFEIKEYQ